MIDMTNETANRLTENIVALAGGTGGGLLGMTVYGWIEGILAAFVFGVVGLLGKDIYKWCKTKICKHEPTIKPKNNS